LDCRACSARASHKELQLSKIPAKKFKKVWQQLLIKGRRDGFPIVSITSDLPGSTGVAEFRKEFPQASFDVGVAESNMISTAAGFSKAGYIPVVDTFRAIWCD
jgi:transketolase C-terminal domain/subunit